MISILKLMRSTSVTVSVRVWLLRQMYIFRVVRGPFVDEFYQCVTFGAYTERWQEQLYSCLSVLLMYVVPLITMLTAYMLIFATIARKSRDFQRGIIIIIIIIIECTKGGNATCIIYN